MSQETMEWLEANTLIGLTAERGDAWHHRKGSNNHFPGPVPLDRVRELIGWEPVTVDRPCNCDCGDISRDVLHPTTGHRLGTFGGGYQPHPYWEWLVEVSRSILGDGNDVQIGSVVQLQRGGIATVQFEVPESFTIDGYGEAIRPMLTAATSLNGKISTGWNLTIQRVVCDNTMWLALRDGERTGRIHRVRHSSNSLARLGDVRATLGLLTEAAESQGQMIRELADTNFSRKAWEKFLAIHIPAPEDVTDRKVTIMNRKRDELDAFYSNDSRVNDYYGTMWGAFNAVNTFAQHESQLRGTIRQERNTFDTIRGQRSGDDATILSQLQLAMA